MLEERKAAEARPDEGGPRAQPAGQDIENGSGSQGISMTEVDRKFDLGKLTEFQQNLLFEDQEKPETRRGKKMKKLRQTMYLHFVFWVVASVIAIVLVFLKEKITAEK